MAESPLFALDRLADRSHHFSQGTAWLDHSDAGQHATPLAYAAFEFRLALERLIVELLVRVQGDRLDSKDEMTLRSFKKIENRIYELAGHQRELDSKIDFINIVLSEAGGRMVIEKINLGELSRQWHQCSELCHITWNLLVCSDANLRSEAYLTLGKIRDSLKAKLASVIAWPQLHESWIIELQENFSKGEATEQDVRARLRVTGVWGSFVKPDGTRIFLHEL